MQYGGESDNDRANHSRKDFPQCVGRTTSRPRCGELPSVPCNRRHAAGARQRLPRPGSRPGCSAAHGLPCAAFSFSVEPTRDGRSHRCRSGADRRPRNTKPAPPPGLQSSDHRSAMHRPGPDCGGDAPRCRRAGPRVPRTRPTECEHRRGARFLRLRDRRCHLQAKTRGSGGRRDLGSGFARPGPPLLANRPAQRGRAVSGRARGMRSSASGRGSSTVRRRNRAC